MADETAEAQFQNAMAMLAADKHSPDWGQVAGLSMRGAFRTCGSHRAPRAARMPGRASPANWDKALDSLALAATSGSQFAARQLLLLPMAGSSQPIPLDWTVRIGTRCAAAFPCPKLMVRQQPAV
jgi:hypothetical protein